jgi:hypothetical protein
MMATPQTARRHFFTFFVKGSPYFRSPSALVPERNGMSMPKHDLSSHHFQRKISEFCEVRIAPISSKRVLENVRPYLISLIIYRKRPPILNGHLDWTAIGEACGVEGDMTAALRKQLRPALDAIIRWLKAPPVAEDVPPSKQSARTAKRKRSRRQRRLPRPENRNALRPTEYSPRTRLHNAGRHQSRSAHSRIRYSRRPTILQAFKMRSSIICADLATATGSSIVLWFA